MRDLENRAVSIAEPSPREEATDELQKYWLGFHLAPYIGPHRLRRLLDHFGDIERAWLASHGELRQILDERSIDSLVSTRSKLDLDQEMDKLYQLGARIVTLDDAEYPKLLAEIPAPPPLLYVRGSFSPPDQTAVAIVGTRRMTAYGRDMASTIASELAEAGVTIVSGLARGIDGVAHEAAIRAGGRSIAVLGSGVNVIYPAEHRNLANDLIANGAVISDYALDTQPDAMNFPPRNRIVSGLSLATVVIEAPTKSGALITCDFALDQGREVLVVPGNANSQSSSGCNRLIRDGARIVTSAADILEDLKLGGGKDQIAKQQSFPMTDDERRLHALLTGQPQHIDEISAAANLAIPHCSALLAMMELKQIVRNVGAQHYIRG